MHEEKRGTGRTTRMCRHALDLLRQGRAVYVYTRADQIDATHRILTSLMRENNAAYGRHLCHERGKAVLTGPASNSHAFVAVEVLDPHYDFQQGKVPGMHPNCVCLVDHHCIESMPLFQALMNHWEQFDSATHLPPEKRKFR